MTRGRPSHVVRMGLFTAIALLGVLVACQQQPPVVQPSVILSNPDDVYSAQSVDVQVAVQRGSTLASSVLLELVSAEAGITATDVTTTESLVTMTVEVDAGVPAGTYPIQVRATGGASVESDAVDLVVLGIEPGAVQGEMRSLLIPTPGDLGFPAPPAAVDPSTFGQRSYVPGEDVPLAFDEMRAVPGEILVRFRAGATPTLQAQAAGAPVLSVDGVTLRAPSAGFVAGTLQTWRAEGVATVEAAIAVAEALQRRPDVVSASPNWLFSVHQAPAAYDLQWHYPSILLHDAWSVEDGLSNPVTVAVLDTGYQDHADLTDLWLPGYDFIDLDADPTDGGDPFGNFVSHGTHVSGTIAMRTANAPLVAGISRGASILPVKVLDDEGSGSFDSIMAGMVWASGLTVPGYTYPVGWVIPDNPNPARVMNMSLGGRVGECPAEMAAITEYLASQDVIVVVSAGNSSQPTDMFAPANCPGVVTVAATGPYDSRAYYSNFGSHVDITAPGGDFDYEYFGEATGGPYGTGVLSTTKVNTFDNWVWFQGTSMAAPHVAGVVALLLADEPSRTYTDVYDAITSTAIPISAEKCDRPSGDECGAGLLDANAALGGAPSVPWAGAPVATVGLWACTVADCSDVDVLDPADVEATGALTRGYVPLDFQDVPPGTYLAFGEVSAPGTTVEYQIGEQVLEVTSGGVADAAFWAVPAALP
ncbi:MAG: S8 family serine peptidase [Trueperaceae bacterium]